MKISKPVGFTSLIRIFFFILFIIFFIALSTNIFYDYLNLFAPLRWKFHNELYIIFGWMVLMWTSIASLFIYRPFCHIVCPIGLISWLLNFISIFDIRFNKQKCDMCGICVSETNCPTVKSILDEKTFKANCFGCGHCIELCHTDALKFRI